MLPLPDAVWVDLDEGRNRVTIGLETGSGRADVERKLLELDIPPAAVVFEVTGRVIEAVDSLRGHVRPLRGGLQIFAVGPGTCTFGFNALWLGLNVFLTNSHCTDGGTTGWGNGQTVIWQPHTSDPAFRIGYEVHDPGSFRCGPPWARRDCRYSDAAIILHETADFDFGHIVYTTSRAPGPYGVGSIYIDPNSPRMQITAEDAYPSQGEVVDKIGRTTGWTYGEVIKTCVDEAPPGTDYRKICQDRARLGGGDGDSGSPVFIWHLAMVTLQGIYWGHYPNGDAVLSAICNIEYDLGQLTTFATPDPPPPVFSVTITGPNPVQPYSQCLSTALAVNGTEPYTYAWTADGSPVGDNSPYYRHPAGTVAFELGVTVTDASGNRASNVLFVNVDAGAQACLDQ